VRYVLINNITSPRKTNINLNNSLFVILFKFQMFSLEFVGSWREIKYCTNYHKLRCMEIKSIFHWTDCSCGAWEG